MLGSDLWAWRGTDLSVDQLLRSEFYLAPGVKLRSARPPSSAIPLLEVHVRCNTDSLPVSLFVFLSVRLSVTLLVILDVCVCIFFSVCECPLQPVFLSAWLSLCLPLCLLDCQSACLCACDSFCMYIIPYLLRACQALPRAQLKAAQSNAPSPK